MEVRRITINIADALQEPELTDVEKKIATEALLQVRGVASASSGGTVAAASSPWTSFWRGI